MGMTVAKAEQVIEQHLLASGRVRNDATTNETVVDNRSFFDVLADILKDGKFTRDDKAYVIVAAENLFDKYVRDFDIPGVSNLVEPFIDDLLKGMIAPLVGGLFERFVPA